MLDTLYLIKKCKSCGHKFEVNPKSSNCNCPKCDTLNNIQVKESNDSVNYSMFYEHSKKDRYTRHHSRVTQKIVNVIK